jgi:hypothetical protein
MECRKRLHAAARLPATSTPSTSDQLLYDEVTEERAGAEVELDLVA